MIIVDTALAERAAAGGRRRARMPALSWGPAGRNRWLLHAPVAARDVPSDWLRESKVGSSAHMAGC